jgi:putative endonuclease
MRHSDRKAHLRTGAWGEKQAARMLRKKRYRILGKRVRVGAREEIDLVARDGDVLVFVEVKTRAREDFGRPADAVDRKKRQMLSKAAVHYLKRLRYPPVYFRFDVVEVIGNEGEGQPRVHHIENAFPLDRRYTLPH